MMPPKKSKAARKAHEEPAPEEDQNQNQPESNSKEEPPKPEGEGPEEDEDGKNINIFRVEVVEGKRARNPPAGEQNLHEWLDENVEAKEGHSMVILDAYEIYVSSCVSKGAFAVSQYDFLKTLKDKFPSGSAIKESSQYQTLVRVKKAKKEKGEKSEKGSKVKADTFKIKMKDIVMRALEEMGNPSKGVRFFTLKQHIATKFPALQVDRRPKFLLAFLERSTKYGDLELVRGIGMCGFFRIPGAAKDEEEEEDEDEITENGDKNEDGKDGDEKEKSGDDDDDEGKPKEEKDEEKKDEDGDEKAEEKEGEKEDGKRKTRKAKPVSGKKGADKKKKKKAAVKSYRAFVVHGDPERIEDTFSLAMTYMVEPKEASARKVQKYLTDYYVDDLPPERFRKCLDSGCEKGFWEQVTGQGLSGRFRLLMDEFDPTADDDLTGQIMNAIVACTEPKQCSANLLKHYLMEYHPRFQIKEKPHLFKKALERAMNKNQIIQLSGIGASGSFQLYDPFTPTPVILRGEDKEDDYESDSEPETKGKAHIAADDGKGYGQFHLSTFQDAYQPRPTKRKGHGRVASKGLVDEPMAKKVVKSGRFRTTAARVEAKKPKKKQVQKVKVEPESDSEESEEDESPEEEEEEEVPKKKRKSAPHRRRDTNSRQSPRKQRRMTYADSSDSDSDPEFTTETKKKSPVKKQKSAAKGAAKKTPTKRKAPVKQESSSDEAEASEQEEEVSPPPKKGRAAQPPKKAGKSPKKPAGRKQRGKADSDDEDDKNSRRSSRPSRGKYAEAGSTDEEEDEDSEEDAPPPPKAKAKAEAKPTKSKKGGRKSKGRK